jgi:hypothetical protein
MKSRITTELERIRRARGGLLRPEDVVKAAKPKNSPLHNKFCWDDSEAAHQYRLWQARELIVSVVVVEPQSKRTIQAYVSMPSDRKQPAGGYRSTIDVLSNDEMREQALAQAKRELTIFRDKYRQLQELAEVLTAIDKLHVA